MTKKKKKISELNVFCTLSQKLQNHLFIEDFPKIPRVGSNFLQIFSFDWIFNEKKYSLFNNSYTIGLNITKPPKCPPYSSRAFQ